MDRSRLRALRLLHPFPSAVNALLVAAIVLLARGDLASAAVLAAAMLTVQFSIGITNDVLDQAVDAGNDGKPLVRGDVSRATAIALAVGSGVVGLVLATTRGSSTLAVLAAGYAVGLAYDVRLKRLGLGWLAYAVAFPLLPVYAWFGATGEPPPRAEILVPIAILAGPALALANALVDADSDREAGTQTIVVRLGRAPSLAIMVGLLAIIHSAAWLTISMPSSGIAPLLMGGGTVTAVAGAIGSAAGRAATRERGWQLQVVAIALLAAGWFAAVVLPRVLSEPA